LNALIVDESTMSNIFLNEPTQAQTDAALAELQRALRMPPIPVPEDSLQLLYDAACRDTGGSQAARNFLFWLAGHADPTGFLGDGGIELRRLDGQLKNAALQVIAWWVGPTNSDRPLYDVLGNLRARFSRKEHGARENGMGNEVDESRIRLHAR
jgi:hypothetical protein